ncbi:MAG: carboxynorspermidine decarboxylase [Candidatus Omnitrophica bacterium]|nr:carboxynorspermidine decarboxylase [Candidatus Omnitrophota bacterium]
MGDERYKNIAEKCSSTPCYVIDKGFLVKNLDVLAGVQANACCSIILALKGFSMFSLFPVIKRYLSGVAASSLDEARLGYEEFGEDVHLCAPAYKDENFDELMKYSSHIIFNSFSQWKKFKDVVKKSGKSMKCGLRINPEHSEVKVKLYDPCAPGSRLGIRLDQFEGEDLEGITGIHFHNLCELNSDSLERTLDTVENRFGSILKKMKWVNFGGGHHITRDDYDIDKLCGLIRGVRKKYGLEVYIEPGEAVAFNAGVLVSTVMDIVPNETDIAVLDTSAAAHMPDVLEMPYRPVITGAGDAGKYSHTYRLGGLTCLAGDIIGDYSFPEKLKAGDRIVFNDMAHYTMVKNNTFNGMRLPSIAIYDPEKDKVGVVREFGYEDYRNRLS